MWLQSKNCLNLPCTSSSYSYPFATNTLVFPSWQSRLQWTSTGSVSLWKVASLLVMTSSVSSSLPLVLPLLSRRQTMTWSLTSMQASRMTWILSPTIFSHNQMFSQLRGKPSTITILPLPTDSIFFFSYSTTIWLGAICPSFIFLVISCASFEPVFRYSLRISPTERCRRLKRSLNRSQWVPLPEPGPPKTKITFGLLIKNIIVVSQY